MIIVRIKSGNNENKEWKKSGKRVEIVRMIIVKMRIVRIEIVRIAIVRIAIVRVEIVRIKSVHSEKECVRVCV